MRIRTLVGGSCAAGKRLDEDSADFCDHAALSRPSPILRMPFLTSLFKRKKIGPGLGADVAVSLNLKPLERVGFAG